MSAGDKPYIPGVVSQNTESPIYPFTSLGIC